MKSEKKEKIGNNTLELESARCLWLYHNVAKRDYSKVDCIIGLGSYDIRVAEKSSALFKGGSAPLLLFTGKLGNWTKDKWTEIEADIFCEHAIKLNVPAEKILLEKQATNIGENIIYAKNMLYDYNIFPKKIILVTKPNTTRRALATCKKQWTDVEVMVAAPDFDSLDQQITKTTTLEFLINEMVGDTQRMVLYSYAGFQIRQEVPPVVRDAYNYLIARGYILNLQDVCLEKDKGLLPSEEIARRIAQLGDSYVYGINFINKSKLEKPRLLPISSNEISLHL
jgi:uncharacterized SAM-binding protein YcdF (DUF218 family)